MGRHVQGALLAAAGQQYGNGAHYSAAGVQHPSDVAYAAAQVLKGHPRP